MGPFGGPGGMGMGGGPGPIDPKGQDPFGNGTDGEKGEDGEGTGIFTNYGIPFELFVTLDYNLHY